MLPRRARSSRLSAALRRLASEAMTAEELKIVEEMANEIIVQNTPVVTRLMSVDDAIAEGAMALFGEKYGDEVRVVSMGQGLRGSKAGRPYSSSSVAVRMCPPRAISASFASSRKALSAPACAGWRR